MYHTPDVQTTISLSVFAYHYPSTSHLPILLLSTPASPSPSGDRHIGTSAGRLAGIDSEITIVSHSSDLSFTNKFLSSK